MIGKHREDYYMAQDIIDDLEKVVPKLDRLGGFADFIDDITFAVDVLRGYQIRIQDDYNDRV